MNNSTKNKNNRVQSIFVALVCAITFALGYAWMDSSPTFVGFVSILIITAIAFTLAALLIDAFRSRRK